MHACKKRWGTTSPKRPRNGQLQNEIGTRSERDTNVHDLRAFRGQDRAAFQDTLGFSRCPEPETPPKQDTGPKNDIGMNLDNKLAPPLICWQWGVAKGYFKDVGPVARTGETLCTEAPTDIFIACSSLVIQTWCGWPCQRH